MSIHFKNLIGKSIMGALTGLAFISAPTLKAASWSEAGDGELSNDPALPTPLSLAVGGNSISGTVVGGTDPRDWVLISVPSGHQLISLVPTSYESVDDVSFIGLQEGTQFIGSLFAPDSYLGYTHFGSPDLGTDILAAMGTADGAQQFTPPLGAGNYVLLIQQTSPESTAYGLNLTVAPVPESSSPWMLGLASATFVFAHARGRRNAAHSSC